MTTPKRNAIFEAFSILGDAIATAAAVRNHRQPDANRLRNLGIDPEQFRQIHRL
jgi:hypothetical protein